MASPRGKNPTQMQLENRSTLLRILRQNRHLCRKDLAEKSGLTGAAVTHLIRDLIDIGLVGEDHDYDGPLSRNAVPLKINYESFLVICVSVRRGKVSQAVADLSGQIIEKRSIPFGYKEPAEQVLERMYAGIAEYIATYKNQRKIVGIGVSLPGLVNLTKGEISLVTNFANWKSVPIRQLLIDKFHYPVVLDEDANAAALAEKWFGCGRGYQNIISVLVGQGVGSGVISNGRISHGAFGRAGEIGHLSIDYDGPLCECGNRGCLELYASTIALTKKIEQISGTDHADICEVKNSVAKGDERIIGLVRESARYVGYAVTSLVNAFNPELITFHGEMTEFGTVWFESVQEVVETRLLPDVYTHLNLKLSTLVEDPVLLGTVAMICEFLFTKPRLEFFIAQQSREITLAF